MDRSPARTWLGSAAIAALLGGCTMHHTPDGHKLWSGSGGSSVRAELGEPDLIEERQRYGFGGSNHVTTFTYLARGYQVYFFDNRVRGVTLINPEKQFGLLDRVRAAREAAPNVKPGDSQAAVLAQSGPPSEVETGTLSDDGGLMVTSSRPYRGELEGAAMEWVCCHWREKRFWARFRNGRVAETGTLTAWTLEHEPGPRGTKKP